VSLLHIRADWLPVFANLAFHLCYVWIAAVIRFDTSTSAQLKILIVKRRLACCALKSWRHAALNRKVTRNQAVARITDRTASQHLWGHVTSSITWLFDTPCHFSIGGPLEWSLYLQPFSRYCTLSVLGSRVWLFKVTWRVRSRDHLIAHMPFSTGGPLEPSLYL